MLAEFISNPIVSLFLAIITVASFIFGIVTWYLSKKKKEISFYRHTNEIIKAGKATIDKLYLSYDGSEITDLSSSKFYIWNSGNTVIDAHDVVSSKPLCIYSTSNGTILDVTMSRVSEETNKFTIKEVNSTKASISFDYVDHGDGCVIQILHTGKGVDLNVDCKIKGGKDIREYNAKSKKQSSVELKEIITALVIPMLSSVFMFIGYYFASLLKTAQMPQWKYTLVSIFLMIVSPVLGFIGGIFIKERYNIAFHRTIPNKLTNNK